MEFFKRYGVIRPIKSQSNFETFLLGLFTFLCSLRLFDESFTFVASSRKKESIILETFPILIM